MGSSMMSGFIDFVSKLASLSYSPRSAFLRLCFKGCCNDQTQLEYLLSGALGRATSVCVGGPRGAYKQPAVVGVVSHCSLRCHGGSGTPSAGRQSVRTLPCQESRLPGVEAVLHCFPFALSCVMVRGLKPLSRLGGVNTHKPHCRSVPTRTSIHICRPKGARLMVKRTRYPWTPEVEYKPDGFWPVTV